MLNNDIIIGRVSKRAGLLAVLMTAALCASLSLLAGEFEQGDDQKQPLPARVDFNRDIFPILSNNCFQCHGPDKTTRMADLRLDVPEVALADRGGHAAVVPRSPEKSELIRRITAGDSAERMPPERTGKRLSPRQISLLKQWIQEGAAWERHWAFVPPRKSSLPDVSDTSWPRNGIDSFILARLDREGLKPSPEAGKAALIRRVTFDLTGLPPTPAEVDAFLADTSPGAYEKVVDRLLASPHYGERMALDWLDASRFADTHGYHIDAGRDMTRWREWVIGAFNRNMPFDQFTVEQLAGDLIENPTLEQKIASGFNRNHMINFEGGAIAEEYQTAYVLDRVNTTGAVWLGLTVGCAQCHNHKFDPITQKEYYQLYAIFNNIREKGLDGRAGNAVPVLSFPTPQQDESRARLKASVKDAEDRLHAPMPDLEADQAQWESLLRSANPAAVWKSIDPKEMVASSGSSLTRKTDFSILAGGANPENETYTITADAPLAKITALRIEVLPDESFNSRGPGRSDSGNFVLTNLDVSYCLARDPTAPRPWPFKTVTADVSQPGFPVPMSIDRAPQTGWGILPRTGERHFAIFEGERPLEASEPVKLTIRLEFKSELPRHLLGRFRLSVTDSSGPHSRDGLGSSIEKALLADPGARTAEQKRVLQGYYRESVSPATASMARDLSQLRTSLSELEATVKSTMVMEEMPAPRDTFILLRGQYDHPGEKVAPGVPAFLPPLTEGSRADRLGLARWLVSPGHPLTARVLVNRYWQMYFGTGLVKTAEDFGVQGERPSHPELLDWLATQMVGSGWDVKAMQRLMVTSATYRQSSASRPELTERDPENRLLARGPRYRLQAEFIRDQALAVSGLLNSAIGGASFNPYQPDGLWEELADKRVKYSAQVYVQSKGRDLYRRSMYIFWKRTSPPPSLTTLDAPNRETCTVRRPRTNTPLQALVLMNDTTYIEAARKLAERMMSQGGSSPEKRIDFAFRLATARKPNAKERDILLALHTKQVAIYRKDPGSARELLKVGESNHDESLDEAELAAWTIVANSILNLDETLTKG